MKNSSKKANLLKKKKSLEEKIANHIGGDTESATFEEFNTSQEGDKNNRMNEYAVDDINVNFDSCDNNAGHWTEDA